MDKSAGKDLLHLRELVVHHDALLKADGDVILLDSGFLGNAIGRIEMALKKDGHSFVGDVNALNFSPICALSFGGILCYYLV